MPTWLIPPLAILAVAPQDPHRAQLLIDAMKVGLAMADERDARHHNTGRHP